MSYTHTTLAEAKVQLSERLGDPDMVFWTDSELEAYVVEAIRTWAAAAIPFRDRGTLATVAGQAFYSTTAISGNLLTQTLTDLSLAQQIERHLMEPVTSGSWTGTEEFTLSKVQAALQNRLNQLILEVGFCYSESSQTIPAGTERVDLPDSTVEVIRAEWEGSDGSRTPLWKTDGLQSQRLFPTWPQNTGIPITYSELDASPLQLSLVPTPQETGTLHLVTASTHAALDLTAGVTLTIPDDLGWVVKWGALADLLSSNRGGDAQRADYCEMRWKQGLEIARAYPSIILARVNEIPAALLPVFDLDSLVPGWSATSGDPTTVSMVSYDLVALYPVPTAVTSPITIDVVRKAPLPSSDADYIQISRETLAALLDYAQHLALFKEGGRRFAESMAQYDRLVQMALTQNEILRARAPYLDMATDQTRQQEERQVRRKEAS
jgi:hypothetical protein